MQPGCPENAQGGGISSVKRYLVDPCLPPRFDDESDGTFRPLEFTLTGADGILRNVRTHFYNNFPTVAAHFLNSAQSFFSFC